MKKSSHNRRRRPGLEGPTRQSADTHNQLGDSRREGDLDGGVAGEDLGDNDLADATIDVVERVRPYFGTILAGLIAGLAALIGFGVVSSQAETSRKQSWDACMAAMSSGDGESFNEVVRRYPGTDAARWAELLLADSAAAEGTELLFIDRQRAVGRLQSAVDLYAALMAEKPQGLLGERTVYGLAKARESLGQLAEARRGYEAIAAEFPGDALAGIAAARAADLGRESTRQWYDWFGAQKIAPPGNATNAQNPAGSVEAAGNPDTAGNPDAAGNPEAAAGVSGASPSPPPPGPSGSQPAVEPASKPAAEPAVGQ
jgi:hypothetical protein